ncbi:MAG: hypothetical protein Q8P50_14960, partial [Bacillota bacterium]|nr:hypothetical protein [Bacillota bacterium]
MLVDKSRRVRKASFVARVEGWSQTLPFRWAVAPAYAVVQEDDGAAVQAVGGSDDAVRLYAPLKDTPGLFWDFARLGEKLASEPGEAERDALVLAWVRRYGLLGTQHIPTLVHLPSGPAYRIPHEEPVADIVTYALRAHTFLSLYDLVLRNDAAGLRARVRLVEKGSFRDLEVDGESVPGAIFREDEVPSLTPQALEEAAIAHLLWRLRGYLRFVSPDVERLTQRTVHGSRRWDLTRTWVMGDLRTAMMFQFYLDLTGSGQQKTGFCVACGEPFPLTKKDRKYCDRCL